MSVPIKGNVFLCSGGIEIFGRKKANFTEKRTNPKTLLQSQFEKKRVFFLFQNPSVQQKQISFLLLFLLKVVFKSNKRLQSQFPSQDNQSKR